MKFKNLVPALLVLAATTLFATTLLLATPAQATLLGRDINGHAVAGSNESAVFLYDTDLNITWLRDANASATAGNTFSEPFGPGSSTGFGGLAHWADANRWANTLTVGAFSGWRLPTAPDSDTSCSTQYSGILSPTATLYYGSNCTASEMGHLWYQELGNVGGVSMTNTGAFQNLQRYEYWSGSDYQLLVGTNFPGTPYPADGSTIFVAGFDTFGGSTIAMNREPYNGHKMGLAMAVRPGDVAAVNQVPEPDTLVLAMAALVGLGAVRRRAIRTSET